jgi:hypothetical protein
MLELAKLLPFASFAIAAASRNASETHHAKFISGSNGVQTLNASAAGSIVILDYGHEVEGVPSFEVLSHQGDTSLFEISYAESLASFSQYMVYFAARPDMTSMVTDLSRQSDGPLPLAAAMDTYRVNRYNISAPGTITNRLVQGGFRYQKLNLTSQGSLSLRNVGVQPTVDDTPVDELPGAFNSSDEMLNRIWHAGARTLKLTEIPKNTVPDFYVVTPEGTIAESQAPQVLGSAVAAQLLSYEMAFDVKPLVGGFGFLVLSDTLNVGIYISCDLADKTISAYHGTTTFGTVIETTNLPANVTLSPETWASVRTHVEASGISITIDDTKVMSFSQQLSFYGSFGFGASFGHKAIFRNLNVANLEGQTVYSHALTNSSFLPDFFSGTNPLDNVVDGSRRDRIAYTGDLDIAGGAALASTHGLKYILGSLDLLGSYQATPGFFIPTVKIQQESLANPLDVNITGLLGYSFNFLNGVASTYMHTGDLAFAEQWAPQVRSMLDWAHSQTLDNGLFNISQISFGGDWNYYDPPQAGVVTKFNVLYAYALQECRQLLGDAGVNTAVYQERLEDLRRAIDKNLWNDSLGAYHLSNSITDGFAQDSNAIAILAGVNLDPAHSSEIILSSLDKLRTPSGPLAFSPEVIAEGFESYISPYASSYHLRAALASNASGQALKLLSSLWEPMANTGNANYTGTFWETIDQDGRPALGLVTSLCHGWAAGPTAELSRYVLGATPSTPGWREFKVAPQTLGLRSAAGKVPTLHGAIEIEWRFDDEDLLTLSVKAPAHLNGTVFLPQPLLTASNETVFVVDGSEKDGPFELKNGRIFVRQKRR